jgi:hypothetical protein
MISLCTKLVNDARRMKSHAAKKEMPRSERNGARNLIEKKSHIFHRIATRAVLVLLLFIKRAKELF